MSSPLPICSTSNDHAPERLKSFYAHSLPGCPKVDWEPLFTSDCAALKGGHCPACEMLEANHGHLNKVAWWTAKFAESMFPPDNPDAKSARAWGYLVGLWHDLGKFSQEFQDYLAQAGGDSHVSEMTSCVDHSTAGAKHSDATIPLFGRLLSYLIAGHHAGLADGISGIDASLEKRLKKLIPSTPDVPPEILRFADQLPPLSFALKNSRSLSFLLRFLFSALVDADFLATEAFMSPERFASRASKLPEISDLEKTLTKHVSRVSSQASASPINDERARILVHCLDAAEHPPGVFSLTVPTGGGKTLSSLAFALKHARLHDLRHIIYVIPFTSIIEQNTDVFRKALATLGEDIVIEHHSNLDPDSEYATTRARLSSENWNARLIVTTNVQFYESLHANKTSRCRKLHRLARSVIILDEAQTLPVEYLDPCLRALEELTGNYHSTVVLCTATQPAIVRNAEFKIGIQPPREIIPAPSELYQRLRRVKPKRLPGKTSDSALINHLRDHPQVLCVVNTRGHARILHDLIGHGYHLHLSALMCPEHRKEVLEIVKQRLLDKLPVCLISTQLIEAGVDIDFPVVFRALAGLDSIAQAAGRCDREGKLTAAHGEPSGQMFIFEPEQLPPAGLLRSSAASTQEVLRSKPPDPLHLSVIESYFRIHYWKHDGSTDQRRILDCWPKSMTSLDDRLCFQFKTCAEKFQLIDSYNQPVIIPYGERGQALCKQLCSTFDPQEMRHLARKLQRYTVNIPPEQHSRLLHAGILIPLHKERFFLLNSDLHYSPSYGLHPEPDLAINPRQLISSE